MNESWTDFEKYVFNTLEKINTRLGVLEGKAVAYGAFAGLVVSLAVQLWRNIKA